jgi:hypothetical protein
LLLTNRKKPSLRLLTIALAVPLPIGFLPRYSEHLVVRDVTWTAVSLRRFDRVLFHLLV